MKTKKELKELSESLTKLQHGFVVSLVSGMTQRQAYLDAGGTAKSEISQDSGASQLASNSKVSAYYDALMEIATFTAVMTKEEAMQRLTLSAKVTITDVCDFKTVQTGIDHHGDPIFQTTWTIKNSEDIPHHIAACIKSVTATKAGPKVELYDSANSIKLLSEMAGWNAAKEIKGTLTVNEVVRKIID